MPTFFRFQNRYLIGLIIRHFSLDFDFRVGQTQKQLYVTFFNMIFQTDYTYFSPFLKVALKFFQGCIESLAICFCFDFFSFYEFLLFLTFVCDIYFQRQLRQCRDNFLVRYVRVGGGGLGQPIFGRWRLDF